MDVNEAILRAILGLQARLVFSPERLAQLVAPKAPGEKQLQAYNLCDGETSQLEICKQTGLDKGSLSRSIDRWVEVGIMIRIGPDQYPLHFYPVPKELLKGNEGK